MTGRADTVQGMTSGHLPLASALASSGAAGASLGTAWVTLVAALAGSFLGGGIPGLMTFFGWRREQRNSRQARRWQDAEVVAAVEHLLVDIDPLRRTVNANPAPGAEQKLWADLSQRRDDVRRQLLVLATGHPSGKVRSAAGKLEVDLFTAAVRSESLVRELLSHRMTPEQVDMAVEPHQAATATCADLEQAMQKAGG